MRKSNEKGKFIVFVLFIICLFTVFKCNVFAEETNDKIVKVGYYENENFQEGASEGAVKSGYAYEYLQKIATYNGWRYEYVHGSWTDMYDAFVRGDIDLLAGLGYAVMVILFFIDSIKGVIYPKKWMCIINPFVFMMICIVLSKVLPQTAFVNGVFDLGQQSVGLFIVFCVLLFTASHYDK